MNEVQIEAEKVIQSLQAQIGNQALELAKRDAVIGTLQEELQKLRPELDELATQISAANGKVKVNA